MAVLARNTILLEGVFSFHPKTTPEYRVTVTENELQYVVNTSGTETPSSKKNAKHTVKFSDVIGCDCMRGKGPDCSAYLNIYAYPHHKKFASKNTLRKRHMLTLRFSHFSTFEENHKEASKWQLAISHLVRKLEIRSPDDIQTLTPLPERKLLVLVNPFSGPGKAPLIFQQRVVPLFVEAGLSYQLIVTEYAGHARELARTIKIEEWYGIIIISGDGLIYEVINGLMERVDWEKAIKIPIGTIPGGSGNALASALSHQAGEPYLEKHILHATFMVAKHSVVPMDLVAVDTCSGKRLYSFLSVAWGIIADVDIESERFRSMGNTRFAVGAVIRIVDLRKYRGRLSFLPADTYKPRSTRHSSIASKTDVSTNPAGDGFQRSVSVNDAGKSSDAFVNSAASESKLATDKENSNGGACAFSSSGAVITDLLPPLSSPVPSNWITIEDDFTLVAAQYQTHLAVDMISAPESRLNDGVIYLGFTRSTVTRVRLIKMFNAMQEGVAVDDPSTEMVRVRAFRLEPLNGERGTLTVDGEVVDYGPVQGQVLPSIARVMTLVKDG